jgi:hypothetical protein
MDACLAAFSCFSLFPSIAWKEIAIAGAGTHFLPRENHFSNGPVGAGLCNHTKEYSRLACSSRCRDSIAAIALTQCVHMRDLRDRVLLLSFFSKSKPILRTRNDRQCDNHTWKRDGSVGTALYKYNKLSTRKSRTAILLVFCPWHHSIDGTFSQNFTSSAENHCDSLPSDESSMIDANRFRIPRNSSPKRRERCSRGNQD